MGWGVFLYGKIAFISRSLRDLLEGTLSKKWIERATWHWLGGESPHFVFNNMYHRFFSIFTTSQHRETMFHSNWLKTNLSGMQLQETIGNADQHLIPAAHHHSCEEQAIAVRSLQLPLIVLLLFFFTRKLSPPHRHQPWLLTHQLAQTLTQNYHQPLIIIDQLEKYFQLGFLTFVAVINFPNWPMAEFWKSLSSMYISTS